MSRAKELFKFFAVVVFFVSLIAGYALAVWIVGTGLWSTFGAMGGTVSQGL